MGLLDFLSSREKKVSNQKLEADISKLCDELTAGIIELSNKANKINELKEKYKQSQSELENSSTNPDSAAASPKASKSIFSSWFGSDEDVPPPPSNQPQHDVNSLAPAAVDNIDANSLSAASTAQLASPAQAIDQSAISQDITPQSPLKDSNSSSDNSLAMGSDMFSSSSDSIQQQPLEAAPPASPALPPASPALPPASSALPPASPELPPQSPEPIAQDAATLSPEQQPQQLQQQPKQPQQNNGEQDNLASILGGKNKKKSKRSKQTIRKTDKKSNSVTQKHKNNNTADKAKAQGLAQAMLQAQGQSLV
jgi:hypothetical protein